MKSKIVRFQTRQRPQKPPKLFPLVSKAGGQVVVPASQGQGDVAKEVSSQLI